MPPLASSMVLTALLLPMLTSTWSCSPLCSKLLGTSTWRRLESKAPTWNRRLLTVREVIKTRKANSMRATHHRLPSQNSKREQLRAASFSRKSEHREISYENLKLKYDSIFIFNHALHSAFTHSLQGGHQLNQASSRLSSKKSHCILWQVVLAQSH